MINRRRFIKGLCAVLAAPALLFKAKEKVKFLEAKGGYPRVGKYTGHPPVEVGSHGHIDWHLKYEPVCLNENWRARIENHPMVIEADRLNDLWEKRIEAAT